MGRKRIRRHTTIHPTGAVLEDAMRFVEQHRDRYPTASALAAAAGRLLIRVYVNRRSNVSTRSSVGLSVPRTQYQKVKQIVGKGYFISADEAYRSALREILYMGIEPPPPGLPSERHISEAEPEDQAAIIQWVSKHIEKRTDARYAVESIRKFFRSLGRRGESD